MTRKNMTRKNVHRLQIFIPRLCQSLNYLHIEYVGLCWNLNLFLDYFVIFDSGLGHSAILKQTLILGIRN